MGSVAKEPKRLFCWTVCAYRKPGMDEDEYHKYMSEIHAPLVKDLMTRYGILRYSMVDLTRSLRSIGTKLMSVDRLTIPPLPSN